MADELQVFPMVGPDGMPTTILLPKNNDTKPPPRWVVVFGVVVNLIVLGTIVAVIWG
jgi:hypothetical protein